MFITWFAGEERASEVLDSEGKATVEEHDINSRPEEISSAVVEDAVMGELQNFKKYFSSDGWACVLQISNSISKLFKLYQTNRLILSFYKSRRNRKPREKNARAAAKPLTELLNKLPFVTHAKTGAICRAKALKMLRILRGQLTFVQHAEQLCNCN